MKYRASIVISGLLLSAALFGCQQRPPAPDAIPLDDIPSPNDVRETSFEDANQAADGDTGIDAATDGDVTVLDAAFDGTTDTGVDVNLPNPCPSAINLNSAGTVSGATTTYMGSNTSAPAEGSIPGQCVFTIASEVAFSYTVTNDSHLRVSTANPGTPATFDTVAWMIDACTSTAASLGCSDDAAPGDHRSAFTTVDLIPAGTTVYVMVAGFSPIRPTYHATDSFELTVTEVDEVPVGSTCDVTQVMNVCSTGAHCINDTSPAVCIEDGTRGGRCIAMPPGCNTGLGCNGDRLMTTSRCVPEIPLGGHCDPLMHTNVCVSGAFCNDVGSGPICM